MEQVLNGDSIYDIIWYLTPKSLYQLRQVRKLYSALVTKNVMCENIKRAVLRNLRVRLCDKYDSFVEMCREVNGKIIGSFITQCMDDDNRTDCDNIVVCVPKHAHIKSDVPRCFEWNDSYVPCRTPGMYTEHKNTIEQYIKNNTTNHCAVICNHHGTHDDNEIPVNCITFDANEHNIYLYELYNKEYPISTKKFVINFYLCDVNKNIYDIRSDKLYIHKINDIFTKHATLLESRDIVASVQKMLESGFEFYDADRKIMSNMDIIRHFYDIVKIKKLHPDSISINNKFVVNDNIIYYHERNLGNPLFHVIETLSRYDHTLEYVNILHCQSKTCIMQHLCHGLHHYHGEHMDFVNERKFYTEIIFIIVT